MGVESVSVVEALSHAATLEISCHSPTRVLLPALESMESKRYTSYRSNLTNVYIQNHTEVQQLNYWERLHELKLYSLQSLRERYMYIYIPLFPEYINIYGTMGHKIITRKHSAHGTQLCALFSIEHTLTQHNSFKKMQ